MASNETLVLSAANLKTIEDNLSQFAESLGSMNHNIFDVTSKMEDVTKNVLTLEEEIKKVMQEIKSTTIISNAKQSIVISQNEWQKKFQHHEQLRRNIISIIEAVNSGLINKSSIENFKEDIIINAPNYWLAPILVAISAWLTDNKELANKALNEALKRDKTKTSLIMSLVYLQVKRYKTSTIWLEYYLNNQNPLELDSLIMVVLNSLNTQAFNYEQQTMVINYIEKWLLELNNAGEPRSQNIETWLELINSLKIKESVDDYPTIKKHTDDEDKFECQLSNISTKKVIYGFFKSFLEREDSQDYDKDKSLKKLINLLVNEYDGEELSLKKEIYQSNLIIESDGDINLAEEKLQRSQLILQEKKNMYEHLHTTIFKDTFVNASNNTKKMALAFQKESILIAYNQFKDLNPSDPNYVVNYEIYGYNGTIKDGYEEQQEKQNLWNYIKNTYENQKKSFPLFNIKMLIAIILAIGIAFVIKQNLILIAIILFLTLGFCTYELSRAYSAQQNIDKLAKIDYEKRALILEDLIAEVVDLKEFLKEEDYDKKIEDLLYGLNYKEYLVNQEERNIRIEVSNE